MSNHLRRSNKVPQRNAVEPSNIPCVGLQGNQIQKEFVVNDITIRNDENYVFRPPFLFAVLNQAKKKMIENQIHGLSFSGGDGLK